MALKTKVKINKITSLSEARYSAGMEVDFLGFPLYGDYEKGLQRFKEISSWVSGPQFVMECLSETDFIKVVEGKIEAEYIQVGLEYINPTRAGNYKLFILLPDTLTSEMLDKLLSLSGQNHYVIVTLSGFTNNKHSLDGFSVFIEESYEELRQNLDTLLSLPITGICLQGSEEEAPGIHNYDHLSEMLEKLEVNED